MNGQKQTKPTTSSTVRETVKSVLFRSDSVTVIEECRRCGTTIETSCSDCPTCGCDDIVTYRIR
ncbi:hypothetical protein EA462_07095 [Natrarchaeobius halalkaliphilus]|uniref:Uncharacterized protein n=1 Tax=Natrarchaeobius halalkaliphilus TaxID=1679091 RepID=A0A3N6LLN2_9EURY|nr:hypothetical protein [Natrarchaeobius halalkaliphilus]RQG89778.1 hypothetical protein EA462_07095 [Natrarchaeobius halalkaliphilus]